MFGLNFIVAASFVPLTSLFVFAVKKMYKGQPE